MVAGPRTRMSEAEVSSMMPMIFMGGDEFASIRNFIMAVCARDGNCVGKWK